MQLKQEALHRQSREATETQDQIKFNEQESQDLL